MTANQEGLLPKGKIPNHVFIFLLLEGVGNMLDLSMDGCRIESPLTIMEPGVSLELRIYAPYIGWPLMIDAARVQWVTGQTFGLAFSWITEPEQQRLGQVIKALTEEMADDGSSTS